MLKKHKTRHEIKGRGYLSEGKYNALTRVVNEAEVVVGTIVCWTGDESMYGNNDYILT